MGGVYLAYSAYFLSSGFSGVKYFMISIMIIMYMGMGFTNVKSLVNCLKYLK
jgi:hypothetical protein